MQSNDKEMKERTNVFSPKELCDGCFEQARLGASRWDRRRSYEWKLTLGLWAGVLAAAKFLSDAQMSWGTGGVAGLIAFAFALFLLYVIVWIPGIWAANQSDKDWEFHFRKQAATLLRDPNHKVGEPPKRVDRSFRKCWDWSMTFQAGITFVVLSAAVLLVLMPRENCKGVRPSTMNLLASAAKE